MKKNAPHAIGGLGMSAGGQGNVGYEICPRHLIDENMLKTGNALSLNDFEEVLEQRRRAILGGQRLKGERNRVSKRSGPDEEAPGGDAAKLVEEMRGVGLDRRVDEERGVEAQLIILLHSNMPKATMSPGKDDTENPRFRRWGSPAEFPYPGKRTGTCADILTLSAPPRYPARGSRQGLGARLERACINFMMDPPPGRATRKCWRPTS